MLAQDDQVGVFIGLYVCRLLVCLCFLLYIYIYGIRFLFLFFWGLIETVRSCFGNTIASVSIDIPASCQEYSLKGSWLVFSFNTATFSNCTP